MKTETGISIVSKRGGKNQRCDCSGCRITNPNVSTAIRGYATTYRIRGGLKSEIFCSPACVDAYVNEIIIHPIPANGGRPDENSNY